MAVYFAEQAGQITIPVEARPQAIKELTERGFSPWAIATVLGVDEGTVRLLGELAENEQEATA